MRFRKFLKPYKTRDSSFREYTAVEGGDEHRGDLPPGRLSQQRGTDTRVQKRDRDHARTDEKTEQVGWLQDNECCKIC